MYKKKQYSLDTCLLCTPYEKKFHRDFDGDLSEDVFQQSIYVEPCLHEELISVQKEIEAITNDINSLNPSKTIKQLNIEKEELLQRKIQLKKEIQNKADFEDKIKNLKTEEIAFIRGSSGCGKSTYLNRLLYIQKKEGWHCFNFNLENSTSFPRLLNHKWNNPQYSETAFKKTDFKLVSVIIHQLNYLLDRKTLSQNFKWPKCEIEGKYIDYLKNMSSNLLYYFLRESSQNYEDLIGIYHIVQEFIEGKLQYSSSFDVKKRKTSKNFSKDLSDYFFGLCNNTFEKININHVETSYSMINRLLNIFLVLSVCAIEKEKLEKNDYRFIIAFDNIEHYIEKDTIFDKDIFLITKILDNYVNEAIDHLFEDTEIEFSGHFQFVMTIRDTTENFIYRTKHRGDFPDCAINTTNWYILSELHESRYNYLFNMSFFDSEEIAAYETIKHVIGDVTIYNNSTGKAIERMFNYNKRRITMYLCSVFSKNHTYVEEYGLLWEKAQNANKESASCYKNAARSYVTRLLLDQIQETDYFFNLQVVGKGGKLGSGYARRIVTFLYNHKITNEEDIYIGFCDLVTNILHSPCYDNNVTYDDCKLLAQIITKMNDPEIFSTKWCQLVIIRFNEQKVDVKTLSDKLFKSYQNRENEIDKYGIKITEAGCYYTEILPTFEYFSTRYCRGSYPLFSDINLSKKTIQKDLPEFNGNEVKNFRCYDIIETVKNKALKCIKHIVEFEIQFFSGRGEFNPNLMENGGYLWRKNVNFGSKGISHPHRIINHHIGYLDNYRIFILEYNENPTNNNGDSIPFLSHDDKRILVKYILNTIYQYIEELTNLSTKNTENDVYLHINDTTIQKYHDAYNREFTRIENEDYSFTKILNSIL